MYQDTVHRHFVSTSDVLMWHKRVSELSNRETETEAEMDRRGGSMDRDGRSDR